MSLTSVAVAVLARRARCGAGSIGGRSGFGAFGMPACETQSNQVIATRDRGARDACPLFEPRAQCRELLYVSRVRLCHRFDVRQANFGRTLRNAEQAAQPIALL